MARVSEGPAYEIDRSAFFAKIGYRPMPHQRQYHDSGARFRIACMGRRAGKTHMAARHREPLLLLPNQYGWIIAPTYNLGMKEFRVMYDDLIVQRKLGEDKRVKRNFNVKQGDMYIELPWGSRVEVRSAQYKDSLVGEGLDWAIVAEAAKLDEDVWGRYLRAALSDKRGEADFVSTPEGRNWFYKLWKLGRGANKAYESWRFPSWVNTEIYPGGEEDPEIKLMRETTLEEWFLQEIAADFTAIVGRIYAEFDEDKHVRPHVFNPMWPNYIAFDWGFANPLAAVEFQVSPSDEIHVWREHYHSYRTLEWHVETLKSRPQPEGYRLDGCFGDAADPEAVEYVSRHLAPCEADPKAKENWLEGIRLVKGFLKENQVGHDDYDRPVMEPKYFVDPTCVEHIREMQGYKTKQNVGANEFKSASVVASGVDDHTLDAMRYALMHLYSLGVRHHLTDVYPEWAQRQRGTVEVREPALAANTGTYFSYDGFSSRSRF